MDDDQWWVLRDGITLGPYGLAELRQYATRGKLHADDLISAAGESTWSPAGIAPPLHDLFPKDGSEDATVALEPALRAMAAPPVPPRRSLPPEGVLRAMTLPPKAPTEPAVAAPPAVAPAKEPPPAAKAAPAKEPPPAAKAAPAKEPPLAAAPAVPRWGGVGMGLVIGLVAASSALLLERALGGPRGATTREAAVATAPRPTAADGGAAAATTVAAAVDGGAVPAAATTGVGRTRETLRALEALMADAAPPADPFDYASLARGCLTSVARANDRAQAAADAARAAEGLRARRAAEARQEARAQQWLAMAWTWDRDWRTRAVHRAAAYGCFDDGWTGDSLEVCPGEWRVRAPAIDGPVYAIDGQPAQPELHRRVEAGAAVHPEAEQHCAVREAQLGPQRMTVTCEGDGATTFELWLPRELASPAGGALAGLRVGDVVRIEGHRVLRREPDPAAGARGPGRWTFEEVPAAGVTIAEHARRCAATPAG